MNTIETILRELYAIDPSLAEHEASLTILISKMLESKPSIVIDDNFVSSLRAELIGEVQDSKVLAKNSSLSFWHRPFAWGGTLAMALVLVLVVSLYRNGQNSGSSVSELNERAFGPLAFNQAPDNRGQVNTGAPIGGDQTAVQSQPGSMAPARPQSGGGGTSAQEIGSKIGIGIAPDFYGVKYVYGGEEFSIDEDKLPVYRRKLNDTRTSAQALIKISGNLADLSNLSNPVVNEFTVSEQRENGYSFMFNLREGWLSINQNWETWPAFQCQALNCERLYVIEKDQLPKDEEIIAIAENFLKNYKIKTESYGRGRIAPSWRMIMMQSQTVIDSQPAVGVDLPVIFPLMIDGREIYDEWGNSVGIYASVNARLKKVTNVQNIYQSNFEKSDYAVERDVEKIKNIALRGGLYESPVMFEGASKFVTVTLGTPTRTVTQMTLYRQDNSRPDTLYVPALAFPVVDISDENYFYRDQIVVPIVSEIIEQSQNQWGGGVKPMPLEVESSIR